MQEIIDFKVIRSSRKTVAIEIRPDGTVLVRAPLKMKDAQIRSFVKEKEDWIRKHLQQPHLEDKLSREELQRLAELALKVIPVKVKHYAGLMNVTCGRITIRNQKTRWGSCSSKGNLNFNCLLMLTPDEVIDYVVIHELCHLIEMNHSREFWAQVENVLPDYKKQKQWLKDHGAEIMSKGL